MRNNFIVTLSTVLILLIPFFGVYKVGVLPLDLVLMIVLLPLLVFTNYFLVEIKLFLFFLGFAIINVFATITTLFSSTTLFTNNTAILLMHAFTFCSFLLIADKKIYIKIANYVGIAASLVVVVQYFSFNLIGISIPFFLPLELNHGSNEYFEPSIMITGRPNSIFLEPAHYAIFILPIFYYNLSTNNIKRALFFLVCLLLSTSTTGFAISILLLLSHYLFRNYSIRNVLYIAGFAAVYIIFNDVFNDIFSRNTEKISSDSIQDNIRLTGGLEYVESVLTSNPFWGIGLNQMSTVFPGSLNYANSYITIFISFGLIGTALLLFLLRYLYFKSTDKFYLVILLLILLTDQLIFNRNFFYLISSIYIYNYKTKIK